MKKYAKKSFIAATIAMAASVSGIPAHAVTSTWLATPTTSNLDLAANYNRTPAAVGPGLTSGDTIAFGSSSVTALTNNLANGFLINGINFNTGASAYTITGANSLAINTNINNNSAAIQTLNTGLILTGGNINVATVLNGTTVLSGVVSQDASARRLSASGLGTLILNGTAASTYTGQTSASGQGTFVIDLSNISGNTNLVSTASQLNLGNGNGSEAGTLIIKGATSGASSQTLAGFTLAAGTDGKIIINANGGTSTTLNLGTTVARSAGSTVTFDISSTGAALTGTTLALTAGTQTANQAVRGYALVKDATGTGFATNVGGALVRYTGATALTAGGTGLTTTAANNYSLAAGGNTTTLADNQTINSLDINTTGSAGILDIGSSSSVLTLPTSGILTSGNAGLTIRGGQLGATNSEVIVNAIGTGGVLISSNISGGATGSFTKSGSDTVTLSGNNTYTGNTIVAAGLLKAGSSTAFSANSTYFISQQAGAGIDLNGNDVTVGALQAGGTGNSGIILGANTLTIGGKNTSFDSNSVISGTGNVTKVGTGVMQIFAANTYTGATTINDGTIRLRNGVVNGLGVNSAVTVGATGTLDLGISNVSIGSLSGSGSVTNSLAGTAILTTGASNSTTTFSGAISNGATPGTMITGLTKTGTGRQILSGANTYTGNTTVNAGTLLISGSLGVTNVTVNTGGSFGAGAAAVAAGGNLTVASGGKLGAVDSAASVMTFSTATASGMNISAAVGGANTGGLVFELGAVGASDQFVLSNGTGSLAIGTGVLNFDDFSFTALAGFGAGVYTLFDTNSALVGTLGSSLTGTIGGLSGTLSSNGQDILLTVVPEPSTYALLGLGLASLFVLRRKARKTI